MNVKVYVQETCPVAKRLEYLYLRAQIYCSYSLFNLTSLIIKTFDDTEFFCWKRNKNWDVTKPVESRKNKKMK